MCGQESPSQQGQAGGTAAHLPPHTGDVQVEEVFLVSCARTPLGSMGGSLKVRGVVVRIKSGRSAVFNVKYSLKHALSYPLVMKKVKNKKRKNKL